MISILLTDRKWALPLALVAIMLLAAGFRLAHIGSLPRGLYFDEAVEGLDALRVIAGERPVYFPDNNGREPLFAYLVAVSVSILGRTPGAIRLVNAVAGILIIPGLYLTTQALFNRRLGLLVAFLGAVTLWPIMLDRLGTRPPLLPLFLSFGLWQGIRGWQTGRWQNWLGSGLLWGMAFYTHLPIRVMPLALALFVGYLVLTKQVTKLWPGALFFAIGVTGVTAPLAIYTLGHFEAVFGRTAQVSVIDWAASWQDIVARLVWQVYVTLQMFVWRGDSNPRHNIPKRAIFDIAMALPFMIALGLSFLRRYRQVIVFCAIWVGVGLLPTILSDEPPHFLRSSAIMPVLFIWPALGLDWIRKRLGHDRLLALLAPATLLALSAFFTARDYLLQNYLSGPLSAVYFSATPTDVAVTVNRFLGSGWQGDSLTASPATSTNSSRIIWLAPQMWGPDAAQSFLTPLPVGPDSPLRWLTTEAQPFAAAADQMLLIVAPDEAAIWASRVPLSYTVSVYDGPIVPLSKLGPTHLPYRVLLIERK